MAHFTEPFHYEFFRHGLLVATLVGALCGMIGVSIILRRMSYIGHGLSHSVFGGAVVSYLIHWNFYLGAGLWGFLSALLINATAKRRNIGGDAAIGIVTTASFALGVALISKSRTFTRNFEAALFGNILGVTREDILVIAAVTAVVALAMFFGYKQLLFATFDPELARVYGVPTHWVDTGFALALAATVVASMNVVGVTLIAAAIVIPPTTARLLTKSFGRLLILSTAIGAACGFFGMFLSYEYDVASGAAIVLLSAALFAAVYAITSAKRLLLSHRQVALSEPLRSPAPPITGLAPATAGSDDHLFD
ncbi:MAG: manganese/iron transport system permease protein [Thermomicrobiales bacterium]|jgi:manganese/iron transport system permease protein/iron/zinc/copper transport system permease protein|nr:manganese/iron transport system permease protein [Thermomicrobiales bacterium]MEA2526380.1 manganese/iron transport system permease protein [Thermomicrobiales bacterium]MEA2582473.1 manganese/iron transport system permease protein [Thermomicrobiales bacterium]MEA2597385.1 manganese/iron transport system permease protein [Thermomicrobiales bacterium]